MRAHVSGTLRKVGAKQNLNRHVTDMCGTASLRLASGLHIAHFSWATILSIAAYALWLQVWQGQMTAVRPATAVTQTSEPQNTAEASAREPRFAAFHTILHRPTHILRVWKGET